MANGDKSRLTGEAWKAIALLSIGIIVGGLGGIIRGDWLGAEAAHAVREESRREDEAIRQDMYRIERRLTSEHLTMNRKLDLLLQRE